MKDEEYNSIMARLDQIDARLAAQKNVLSVEEAAAYTGYKKSHLYRLTSDRKIPFYKPRGGNIYFRREELDRWLCRNRQATAEEISSAAATHIALRNIRK